MYDNNCSGTGLVIDWSNLGVNCVVLCSPSVEM